MLSSPFSTPDPAPSCWLYWCDFPTNQRISIVSVICLLQSRTTPTTLSRKKEITEQQYSGRLQIQADFSWVFYTGILQPLQNLSCSLPCCPKQSLVSAIYNITIFVSSLDFALNWELQGDKPQFSFLYIQNLSTISQFFPTRLCVFFPRRIYLYSLSNYLLKGIAQLLTISFES